MAKTKRPHTTTRKRNKKMRGTKKSQLIKRKTNREMIRTQKPIHKEEETRFTQPENKDQKGDTKPAPISPYKQVNKRPMPLKKNIKNPIPKKDDEPEGTPLLEKFSQNSLETEMDAQKKEIEDGVDEQQHGKARKKDSDRDTEPKPSVPAKQPRQCMGM